MPEVVNFLHSNTSDVEGTPSSWPKYLSQAMRNLPRYWSIDALVRSQQTSIYLELAAVQFDGELRRAKKMKKNYSDQGKLVISLTTTQEKVVEKIKVLEMANRY